MDYDAWLGPAPARPFNENRFHYQWHWNWDYGNGDIGNQGIHEIDMARWGLGKPDPPRHAVSIGGRYGYEDDGETPNTQIALFDYGDSLLIFEVRGLPTADHLGARVGVVFHGTEGYLVANATYARAFDPDGGPIASFDGAGDHFRNFIDCVRSRRRDDLAAESSLFDRDGNLVRTFEGRAEDHFVNFIKAARNGRRGDLNADIREGHQSSALCHIGNISHRLGRPERLEVIARRLQDSRLDVEVGRTFERMTNHLRDNGVDLERNKLCVGPLLRIDSEREAFSGHPDANALLTREYRRPFVVPAENQV